MTSQQPSPPPPAGGPPQPQQPLQGEASFPAGFQSVREGLYPGTGWQTPTPDAGAGPAPGWIFAPHGPRLVAYIIDGIIIGLVTSVVSVTGVGLLVAASGNLGPFFALVGIVLLIAAVVVGLAYFPWFWAHGGQTPGMRVFGLWVVRDRDGGTVDGGQAVLRLVGYFVSGFVFYLGFAWILIDARRRGWQDLIAGTVVIARP